MTNGVYHNILSFLVLSMKYFENYYTTLNSVFAGMLVTVLPTGQELISALGDEVAQVWVEVDTGNTVNFTKVSTGTLKTYSEVDTGTSVVYTEVSTGTDKSFTEVSKGVTVTWEEVDTAA